MKDNLHEHLESLWGESTGSADICVAVLDGPVDLSHPCFTGANIARLTTLASGNGDQRPSSQHGTQVASIIFGSHHSPVLGIAPGCRGLIVPVFRDGEAGGLAPCSQIDLARAITQAVTYGANVINISGGQLAASSESDRLLANAVRLCQENNVLIVAAGGNDGCECLHLPAAIETVLAVGAMNAQGWPLPFSNWGEVYQSQGILALGEDVLVATPGGGTALKSGTSFSAPIAAGIVALLLSIQKIRGQKPDPHAIKEAILNTALPCVNKPAFEARRCLAGRINISGVYSQIINIDPKHMLTSNPEKSMTESIEVGPSEQPIAGSINDVAGVQATEATDLRIVQSTPLYREVEAHNSQPVLVPVNRDGFSIKENQEFLSASSLDSTIKVSGAGGDCGCNGGGGVTAQLVYALGELGTDYGSQARQDSFTQAISPNTSLLEHLNQNPWDSESLIWTLNLDATPIYAILPTGPFASITYERLRLFLADTEVERVSIPGFIGGKVRLMSGQVVPAIIPEVRGMYSWSTDALVSSLIESSFAPEELASVQKEEFSSRIKDFMNRIYYDFRNLGVTPQERALNFSATNLIQASEAIGSAALSERELDSISVEKSPICRPDSDCYDVKLSFFYSENTRRSKRIFRFTVDVSDVIPVTIGEIRSWSQA